MIAFACAITDAAHYERFARPGIRLAAEPDSAVLLQAAPGPNFRIYNLLLEQAAACPALEALVLVNERAEILDRDLCGKIRRALGDRDVGVIGCIGASGVRSIAWWEGRVSGGSSVYRPPELDGEEFPPLLSDGWNGRSADPPREVDTVDGVMMVLSPWAVRNIRFDESLGPRYGYDFDFCLQVRAAQRKVVTEDLQVAHYYPLGVVDDPDTWVEAHMTAAEKWDGRMPGGAAPESEVQWKQRARRAEGEAAAARLLSATKTYEIQALAREQERQEEQVTGSLSWRITKPLRELGVALAKRRPPAD